MSVEEHKRDVQNLGCMIITISDTRTDVTDKSGKLMMRLLEEAGHRTVIKKIVTDDRSAIRNMIETGSENPDIDVILTNGGTGISYRDVTIETIKGLLDKEMPGFGELFRMLSYQVDIGTAAMLSRAIAGVSNHTAIFSTPGSGGAVKLAMEKLILPELSHVVHEIKKDVK
ncbi:MogA/MoaB family molybdenum cofactor biosynthesis protein [Virgibacillus oceani]|uniref:Molybdenum cofactor biosynthesis protein B n=1 Tax=Virgibacillus oceani TaxID=1479511 RepID=A0A917GYS6_9BACI|nr:MogA/MoaB family molybdenum cofactor biosynthesis protein [Virgibacillus oceani]GGG61626.1 molybdenum cofactor biosynthesis protein B [Virgibacillus oceani]